MSDMEAFTEETMKIFLGIFDRLGKEMKIVPKLNEDEQVEIYESEIFIFSLNSEGFNLNKESEDLFEKLIAVQLDEEKKPSEKGGQLSRKKKRKLSMLVVVN